ncbi:MAG: hypothetical protein N4A41_04430 [Crocinitomicaceae bacterium]|jgi:hypothetical protein|nr:hypothetical protein [Crocinitomicaceae bacterium]
MKTKKKEVNRVPMTQSIKVKKRKNTQSGFDTALLSLGVKSCA